VTFKQLDLPLLAETVDELVNNEELREALADKGEERLQDFTPEKTEQTLRTYLN